jgi:hypothetical protein
LKTNDATGQRANPALGRPFPAFAPTSFVSFGLLRKAIIRAAKCRTQPECYVKHTESCPQKNKVPPKLDFLGF